MDAFRQLSAISSIDILEQDLDVDVFLLAEASITMRSSRRHVVVAVGMCCRALTFTGLP